MLFAMLWQSVAMARVGSSVNVLADLQHAALHWQGESNHHDDDGSYHLDDSNAAAQHVLNDHMSTAAALLLADRYDLPAMGSAAPSGLHETRVPHPTLDGLLRPPRSRA